MMSKIKHNIDGKYSALLLYVTLNYFISKLKQLGFSFINRKCYFWRMSPRRRQK